MEIGPIIPPMLFLFFTASYRKEEEEPVFKIPLRKKLKLVYIGAIYDGKNPEIGIYLSKILVENEIDFEFTYCGDGVMRRELEELSEELGLSDHVTFFWGMSPQLKSKKS